MNGAEFMQPVFHFLDNVIREDGDHLYRGLVYASIPLIAWILSGGLRRRPSRRDSAVTNPIIIIRLPTRPPPWPPPIIERELNLFCNNDEDSFAA
jgi:hypothetical protein